MEARLEIYFSLEDEKKKKKRGDRERETKESSSWQPGTKGYLNTKKAFAFSSLDASKLDLHICSCPQITSPVFLQSFRVSPRKLSFDKEIIKDFL